RLQWLLHRHWHDLLPIAGQSVRDVFQTDERTMVHQVFAKQQRRGAGLALDRDRLLGLSGAGIVFDCDALDGLDHAEVAGEAFPPGGAPFVAVLGHALGIGAEQRVEQIIRVARKEGSRESQEPSCRFVEHAKGITLGSVAGQLMDLSRSLRRCIAAPELPLDELTVPVENRSCGRRTSSPTAVAEPASPLAGSIDPAPSGRSAQTALEPSEPLGWAEIR